MKFNEQITDAVERCLNEAIPFVVFVMPGEDEAMFFASAPARNMQSPAFADDSNCFFINFFDNDEPYTPGVRFNMSTEDLLRYSGPLYRHSICDAIRPRVAPTLRVSYHEAFAAVKPRLKTHGGKVVLSRHRSIFTKKSPRQIAEEYFSLTDTTFRYLCYTPETGVWLGSTPEVLLESDSARQEVRTMSLAGTRPADGGGEWDSKNTVEQAIVTDSISRVLSGAGLEVEVGERTECRFLNIAHLCTPIKARGAVCVPELMAELSPTPAVAGYPRELALEEIGAYETHRRHCYGGYVGVRINGDYHAYVNLRCAFLSPAVFEGSLGWLANLYAGGGIVTASIEDDEWLETEAKTRVLAGILLGRDGTEGYEGPRLTPAALQFKSEALPF